MAGEVEMESWVIPLSFVVSFCHPGATDLTPLPVSEPPDPKINTTVASTKCKDEIQDVLAFDVVARLVDMLKHPSLEIQRKVASVLEFVATSDTVIDKIISANIESGLLAIFQQVELNGM
ncbi:hypothetical protein SADUNF_Sadunf10G0083000 [Salix dunnii]|uniref:Uncharacterized protein n=1 Tax=Salix dunnii TaxID=1413687 RepID=A0A835JQD0_9ROSI|nr:hypothetical protein SADUNF_Sadunf10G0083000 [Salix dunnii]